MKSALFATGLALLIASAVHGPARAQIRLDRPVGGGGPSAPSAGIVTGYTVDDALNLAKAAGFANASIAVSDDKVKFVAGQVNGVDIAMYMLNCKEARCGGVRFYAYFGKQDTVDLTFINAFNLDYLAKLIKTKNGNLTLLFDATLYGGVTADHMKEMASIFVASIKSAMDYKPS